MTRVLPVTLTAATTWPSQFQIGAPMQRIADFLLLVVHGVANGARPRELLLQAQRRDDGIFVVPQQAALADQPIDLFVRKVGEQALAEAGAVDVHPLANPGCDAVASGALHLRNERHLFAIEHGQVRRHGRFSRERVEKRRSLLPQHDAVDGHARDVDELHAGHVAPGVGVALQVPLALEREQQRVDRALRESEMPRELRERQATPRLRDALEDGEAAGQGRDRGRLGSAHHILSFCPGCRAARTRCPE